MKTVIRLCMLLFLAGGVSGCGAVGQATTEAAWRLGVEAGGAAVSRTEKVETYDVNDMRRWELKKPGQAEDSAGRAEPERRELVVPEFGQKNK